MKLRVKYIPDIGYFAQAKLGTFSFWGNIGKHVSGYGLYSSASMEHPLKTYDAAVERARLYEKWLDNCEARPVYTELSDIKQRTNKELKDKDNQSCLK